MKSRLVIKIVAIMAAALFLYVAAGQLVHYQSFRVQLHKSFLLAPVAGAAAILLPVTELIIAGLLMRPANRLTGLIGAMSLLSIFTVHLVAMLQSGEPCDCGEVWQQISLPAHIIVNILLILITGVVIVLSGRKETHTSGFA